MRRERVRYRLRQKATDKSCDKSEREPEWEQRDVFKKAVGGHPYLTLLESVRDGEG